MTCPRCHQASETVLLSAHHELQGQDIMVTRQFLCEFGHRFATTHFINADPEYMWLVSKEPIQKSSAMKKIMAGFGVRRREEPPMRSDQ